MNTDWPFISYNMRVHFIEYKISAYRWSLYSSVMVILATVLHLTPLQIFEISFPTCMIRAPSLWSSSQTISSNSGHYRMSLIKGSFRINLCGTRDSNSPLLIGSQVCSIPLTPVPRDLTTDRKQLPSRTHHPEYRVTFLSGLRRRYVF